MKNDLLLESETTYDSNTYLDPLTMDLLSFIPNDVPQEYVITQTDIDRSDIFFFTIYGTLKYSSFVLWYNGKASVYELAVNDILLIPSSEDLEIFYIDNIA